MGDFHVKGSVALERFDSSPLFRLAFEGKRILPAVEESGNMDVCGIVYLPTDCTIEIHRSLLESRHSCAHGIRAAFGNNSHGIQSLQLIIPTNNAATNIAGLAFGEALEHVEAECQRYAAVGNN